MDATDYSIILDLSKISEISLLFAITTKMHPEIQSFDSSPYDKGGVFMDDECSTEIKNCFSSAGIVQTPHQIM